MNIKSKALRAMMERRVKRRFDAKKHALEYFRAEKNKKKLPTFHSSWKPKKEEYAKMSIEDYEKKYPSFKD